MNVTIVLLLLLVGSIITYVSGNKWASKVALVFSIAAFTVSIYLLSIFNNGQNISYLSNWINEPKISLSFLADGLSMVMIILTTSLTSIIVYSSFGTTYANAKSFYALVLFMSFAMVGTFLAADGLLYYIFWELALIPIYFIALIWGNGDVNSRKKAVLKFFIYTLAGSLFMLVAFIYLYQQAGSFLLQDLYKINLTNQEQSWIFLAFFLAYAIKIPLIPFHTWQAKVYQKAPSVGTMLLSGIMLKMGLYSVIRWQIPLARYTAIEYKNWYIIIGIVGVIYGSILAIRQKNLKKLLAYSSLAHVGLIAAGTYTLTVDGLRGAILQMIAHGFVVVGLFFVSEIIDRRYQTYQISDMGGIRQQAPKFTSMFMILVLASVALPGTFNFVGEFTVLYSLFQTNIWFAILGGTTIILGAYYMLKMFQKVMLGETNKNVFGDITIHEIITLLVLIIVIFFFGLYPKPILELITPSIENIIAQINRIN